VKTYILCSYYESSLCPLICKHVPREVSIPASFLIRRNNISKYVTFWVIKSRRLRWAGHVARMVERRGAYRALVEKPEGRRPFGRPRRRWEDNIKMGLREVGWGHGLDKSGPG
jgi:hypothetical protein